MKKRMLAILMGIVMLMSLSLTVSAAGINHSARDRDTEPCQSAEEFFSTYNLRTSFNNQKEAYNDYYRELCSTDEGFEEAKEILEYCYGVSDIETVDEAVEAFWEYEGLDFFYKNIVFYIKNIPGDIGNDISIDSDNCFDEEVQRLVYIGGIWWEYEMRDDYDSCEADATWTMEEIKDYVYNEMFETETTTSVEETTAPTEETTEPVTDEETTEPASTDETTASDETTAQTTTAASHEDETDNPNTGDVSMLMYGVTALVSGLGAVATRKRK